MHRKATQPAWARLSQTENGSWTGPGCGSIPARVRRLKRWRRRLIESQSGHSFLGCKERGTEEEEAEEGLKRNGRGGHKSGAGSEGRWRCTGLN